MNQSDLNTAPDAHTQSIESLLKELQEKCREAESAARQKSDFLAPYMKFKILSFLEKLEVSLAMDYC